MCVRERERDNSKTLILKDISIWIYLTAGERERERGPKKRGPGFISTEHLHAAYNLVVLERLSLVRTLLHRGRRREMVIDDATSWS